MALGAGPGSSVPIPGDMLAAIAAPRDAMRALKREIANVNSDIAKLTKSGLAVDQQLVKLQKLEQQYKQLSAIDRKTRDMMARNKQALALGRVTSATLTANAIGNLVRGEINAQTLVALSALAVHHERVIAKIFGRGAFGRAMQSFAQVAPPIIAIVGQAASSITEGYAEYSRLKSDMQQIGEEFKLGKLSKAQELYANKVLTETWFDDPKKRLKDVEQVGLAMASVPPYKLQQALSGQTFKRSFFEDNTKFDAQGFLAGVSYLEQQRRSAKGGQLTQQEYARVMIDAFTDYANNQDLPNEFIEKLAKQLISSKHLDMQAEQTNGVKFLEAVAAERERAASRVQFIPARMEY